MRLRVVLISFAIFVAEPRALCQSLDDLSAGGSDLSRLLDSVAVGSLDLPKYEGAPDDLAYLRGYIVDVASSEYQLPPGDFEAATLQTTSVLRDLVHKVNYQLSFRDDIKRIEAGVRARHDVGAMWRHPSRGRCGHMSFSLYHIYRSLGYDTNRLSAINGRVGKRNADDTFDRSHSSVEVRISGGDHFILQDPTFNFHVADRSGVPLDFIQTRFLIATDPDSVTFVSAQYAVDRPSGGEILDGLPRERENFIRKHYFGTLRDRHSFRDGRETVDDLARILVPWRADLLPFESSDRVRALVNDCRANALTVVRCVKEGAEKRSVIGIDAFDLEGNVQGSFLMVALEDGSEVLIHDSGEIIPYSYDALVPLMVAGEVEVSEPGLLLLMPARFRIGDEVALDWLF